MCANHSQPALFLSEDGIVVWALNERISSIEYFSSPLGSVAVTVQAFDPDVAENGVIVYTIIAGSFAHLLFFPYFRSSMKPYLIIVPFYC